MEVKAANSGLAPAGSTRRVLGSPANHGTNYVDLMPSLRHAVKACVTVIHVVLVESWHMKIPWRNTNELLGSYNYCVYN